MADDQDSPQITPQDRDIAIRTMIGEENSPDGMAGVASVLLNRAKAGNYGGNSLAGVAFAPHQFESWDNPQKLLAISPTDPAYQRAAKIFDGVASGQIPDLTKGATNFYAPKLQSARGQAAPSWATGTPVSLGSTLFYGPNSNTNAEAPATKAINEVTSPLSAARAPSAVAQPPASNQADPLADYPIAPAKNAVDEPPVTGPGGTIGVMTPEMEAEFRAKGEAPASPIASAAASAPSAPGATPDFLTDYLVAPSTGSASPPPPPGYSANGQPVSRSLAMAGSFLNGAPIIGPYLEKGVENAAAWARSKLTGEDQSQVLNEMRQRVADSQNAYSKSAALSGLTGGVVATVPAMALAPAAFGISDAGLIPNALASTVTGGVVGGADAGVRSSWNPSAMERGAGIGAALGAAGPVAGHFVGAGVNAASNLLSRTTPAARNVANVFEAAGISPLQAEMTLARMGPNATLADIDPALTGEASGLAALGGRPTSILKNAYAARAANADDRASQLLTQTLGPKPDLSASIAAIENDAATRAGPAYEAGRSAAPMDVTPVLANIDAQLPNASGPTANVLSAVKGFLTNKVATQGANGLGIVPKDDPGAILGARQALDDLMYSRATGDAKLGPNALRVASNLRSQIDSVVKSNPNFAQGDAIYAKAMKVRDALQEGQDVFKRATRAEDLTRIIGKMSPEELSAYRQGARVAIADTMENASLGELSGALGMFKRGTANRQKLDVLFPNAQKTLDALHTEAAFRSTENEVMHNSQTAARQAIRNKYAPTQSEGGIGATAPLLGEAIYGGPGAAIATAARAAYKGVKNAYTEAARAKLNRETAAGLASTGAAQTFFLGQIERAANSGRATNAISKGGSALVNLYTRNAGRLLPQPGQ
jgi:hypothetical protein